MLAEDEREGGPKASEGPNENDLKSVVRIASSISTCVLWSCSGSFCTLI